MILLALAAFCSGLLVVVQIDDSCIYYMYVDLNEFIWGCDRKQ